jgi:hypothetical protein
MASRQPSVDPSPINSETTVQLQEMNKPEARDVAIPEASWASPRHSILTYGSIALPGLVFLFLYSWRPLKLGFYADDWYVFLHPRPGSLMSLSGLLKLYSNRPLTGLTSWFAEAFVAWDPARAQVVNIMLTAAAACSVGWLCHLLTASISRSRPGRLWGAGVASAAYLAFPWALGFSAWITTAVSIAPATILFCAASHLLIAPGRQRLSIQLLACLAMAASFLTYESFYGQFIVVLVLAAVLRGEETVNWTMLRPVAFLVAVNLACFLYNRSTGGIRKTFREDWYITFINAYFRFAWPNVLASIREVAVVVVVCSIFAIGLGLYFLSVRIGGRRSALVVLSMLAGCYAAGLLYALAGYGLITVGIFARTTAVLSVHGALFLGILGAAAAADWEAGRRWLSRGQVMVSIALLAAFGTASSIRLADWSRSWEMQMDVLGQFPRVSSETEAFENVLLYVGPLGPPAVPIASLPWEITGAVAYALRLQSPEMGARAMASMWVGNSSWFADMPNWSTTWDGESFLQRMCGSPTVEFSRHTDTLKIWRVGEKELEMAPVGFHSGCDILLSPR